MSKYLELFKDAFDDSIGAKTKPENKPYIGYSLTEGKLVYTVVPKPVTGPADNEIWYTTVDGKITYPYSSEPDDTNIYSNTYVNGKGVLVFKEPLTSIWGGWFNVGFNNFDYPLLTSIILPNSIEYIGDNAFMGQPLDSINITDNIIYIGSGAFYGTDFLESMSNDESNWKDNALYINNCLITVKRDTPGVCYVDSNCRLIAGSAFSGSLFSSVIIPYGVENICGNAFSSCESLTDIIIPESVTKIHSGTFYLCKSLKNVTIPNSITYIGNSSFYDCTSLNEINYNGTKEQWNRIEKEYSWNSQNITVHCLDGDIMEYYYD
jgi:hypothetical protein